MNQPVAARPLNGAGHNARHGRDDVGEQGNGGRVPGFQRHLELRPDVVAYEEQNGHAKPSDGFQWEF
jgi:hypothetical protein